MSTDRDTARIVRAWLRRDEHDSADRVLETVLVQLDTKPQRRVTWSPVPTLPAMSNFATLAAVATTLVAVAVVGIGLFSTVWDPSVGVPTKSPVPSRESPDQSPGPEVAELWVRGADPQITAAVAVPEGWTNTGHAVTTGSGSTHAGISFWTISAVYVDPCNWDGSEVVNHPADAAAASSISALMTAWAPESGRASATAPSVTEPRDAMLDGYSGAYVELTPPTATDFTVCDGGAYRLWVARDDAARFLQASGRVVRLWLLDVGPQVLVVDVTYTPPAEGGPEGWHRVMGQLEAVIASVDIRSSGE